MLKQTSSPTARCKVGLDELFYELKLHLLAFNVVQANNESFDKPAQITCGKYHFSF